MPKTSTLVLQAAYARALEAYDATPTEQNRVALDKARATFIQARDAKKVSA